MQKKDKTKRNASKRNKMHGVHGEIQDEESKAHEVQRREKKKEVGTKAEEHGKRRRKKQKKSF